MIQNYNLSFNGMRLLGTQQGSQRKIAFGSLLVFMMLLLTAATYGQVSLTATSGTATGNFTSVNAAFAAINAGTHKGDIVITVTGSTTEPSTMVPLLKSASPSSYTSVKIVPSGNATINSAASPAASRGIIELAGADNVTIDGDDPLTSGTQNLSIVSATSTSILGVACIRLSSNSTTGLDGANNVTVKNCIITGARGSISNTNTSYGIQFSDGTSTSSASTGAYSSINTVIQNNTITRCYYGINAIGNSTTYLNTGLQILNNTIGSATEANYVALRAINLSYTSSTAGATSAVISGNDIRSGHNYGNASMGAIEIGAANAGISITKNNIHDCINPTSSIWGMYGIWISSGTSNSGISITNNFIRDIKGAAVSSMGNQYGGHGIYINATVTGLVINHNTIYQNASGCIGTCIMFGSSATSAAVSQMMNNILVDNVASTYSCVVYTAATGNLSGGTVNNNDYYVNASGVIGYYSAGTRATLAAWKTATSKDANSLNILPPFTSTTDLHIPAATTTLLESAGASVATTGVSTDYDGQTRPGGTGTAPDIGADEFDGVADPCPQTPSTLASSLVTNNSATISWAAASPVAGSGYEYYLSTSSTAPTSGTAATGSVGAGVVSKALTGLTGNTQYYFWVRSNCDGTNKSTWTGSATFTTLCDAVAVFPYATGFNAATIPSCWTTSLANATQTGTKISYVTTGTSPTVNPNEGTYMVLYNAFSNTNGAAGSEERLITRAMNTTGISNVTIKFDWVNENSTSYNSGAYLNEGVQLQYSVDGTNWTNLGTLYPRYDATLASGVVQWNTKTLYSSEIGNQANVYLAFKFHSEYGDNMYLDNVNISQTPSCVVPSGLAVTTNAGAMTANVSWTAPGFGTPIGYEYAITTSSTPPASGTAVTGTSVSNLPLLATSTTYYLHVRTNCDTNGYSSWVTSSSFVSPPITAKTSGNFATPTNWNNGTGPDCNSVAYIPSGIAMTVTSGTATAGSVTVQSGGTLTVSGGTLTIGCTGNNATLSDLGTLVVSGGTLAVNGNLSTGTGSTFTHSAGDIIVDGNSGTIGTSVASGTPIVAFGAGTLTLTGGTLTIVDPHLATTAANGFALQATVNTLMNATPAVGLNPGHTLRFGDGISTQGGGHASGFYYNLSSGTSKLNLGNVIAQNSISATNRVVTLAGANSVINGNLTVTEGTYNISNPANMYIGGNIVVDNDGTLITGTSATLNFADFTGASVAAQTVPQSVSVIGGGQILTVATGATANFSSINIRNTSSTGVTFNALNQIAGNALVAANASGTITFNGKASVPSGKYLLSGTAAAVGTVVVTSGGMLPGSGFARGLAATTTGSTIPAGSTPDATTQMPFIDASGNARNLWVQRVTPTGAGIIGAVYTDVAGVSNVSITDGAYTVNKRSNGYWTLNTLGTAPAAATFNMAVSAPSVFDIALTSQNARITTETGVLGTHQNGTTLPIAQRTGYTLSDLTAQPFYIGVNSADIPFTTVQSGNWNDPLTWSKQSVPTAADTATILAGHTVTVDGSYTAQIGTLSVNSTGALTLNANTLSVGATFTNGGTTTLAGGTLGVTTSVTNSSGATINVNSGTLNVAGGVASGFSNSGTLTLGGGTINVGSSANVLRDRTFTNAGTLTVTTGTMNIYGNMSHSSTSTFNQSGGDINIDGNNGGTSTNSVGSSTALLSIATTNLGLSGGNITFVDPHYSGYYALGYSGGAAYNMTTGSHTFVMGNGSSTDTGDSTNGFRIYVYVGSYRLSIMNLVVNGGTGTGRHTYLYTNTGINGNLTINANSEFRDGANVNYVAGNIVNNGMLTTTGTLYLGTYLSSTAGATANAQTISGTGTFRNSTTTATASMASLTVNNTNASGVTLSVPLSISSTLTLTAGKVFTTTTNLLTLGTATAAGTMSNIGSATAYIDGPFARTFAASRTATSTNLPTLFPVGKGGVYMPFNVDPTTAATGPVVFRAEVFTTNSGTKADGVVTLSNTRWEVPVTSGAANLTSTLIKMGDAGITTNNKLVQSDAAAGTYSPVPATSTYAAAAGGYPNSLTSGSAIAAADYKGNFAYGDLNPCTAPTNQATAFVVSQMTPTASNSAFTVSYTAATSAPSHYLVVRYDITSGAAVVTNPADYSSYAANATLGAGTVVYSGTGLTFSQSVANSKTFQYYVYSYNNTGCYGPVYNTVSPLVQSVTTCTGLITAPGTPTVATTPAATTTSFRATWTASAGNSYVLDVATNSGFTTYVAGYQALALTDNFKDITGLTANTTYYVRVKAINGNCLSAVTSTLTFTTPCAAVDAPLLVDFNAGTQPSCWTTSSSSTSLYSLWRFTATSSDYPDYEAFSNGRTNGTFAWVDGSTTTTNDVTLYSPNINLATLTVPEMSFDYFSNYTGGANSTFKVDVYNGTTWTNIYTDGTDSVNWRTITLSLSAYAGTTVQLRFVVDKSTAGTAYLNDILLDNINIHETPSCVAPATASATLNSTTSVNLAWTAPASGATAVGYEYAVTTSATPPASGTATTATSVSAYAVTANTSYYLHVRTNCGSTYSSWTSVPFYTGYCLAGTTTGGYEYITSASFTGGYTNISNSSGDSTGGYSNYTSMIYSQSIGTSVSFNIGVEDYSEEGVGVSIFIDWNNDLDFDDANERVYTTSSYVYSSASGTFSIPAATPNGSYRMRVRMDYSVLNPLACGTITYGETEDYTFKVVSVPTCYVPTSVSATSVTATTANLSWVAPTTAPVPTGYEYAVTTSATPPASGTATTGVSVNGYSGLVLNNTYYLHVRSNCAANGYSDWATYQFSQGYCAATSTGTGYYLSSFSTTGGATNITNNGTTLSTNGYGNYTAMAVSQSEGNSITISAAVTGGTHGINVWVDWNDDLTFSASEKMHASGSSYVSSTTGSFMVPIGATEGNHQMRVRANYYSTDPSACGSITYGETEDYTFTVLPAPPRITSFSPAGLCVGAGTTVTLTGAHFTGATSVKFNGTSQPAFTVVSDTSITTTVPAGATTGVITVTSPNGTGTSATSFNVYAYPTVADITGGGISACMPDTIQLSDATPSGTWSSSNTAIATVNSAGLVTPVTAGTVTITYTVTSNGCASSKTTSVTFNQPVGITTNPVSHTATPGSDVVFSVVATGTGLTYQWQVSTDGLAWNPITDDDTYSGATTAVLTVGDITMGMSGYSYKVTVMGTSPCGSVTSSVGSLNVSNVGILTQPSDVTMCVTTTGTATFTAAATSTDVDYEWREDAGTGTFVPLADGTVNGVTYSGSATNELTLTGLTPANSGWKYKLFIIQDDTPVAQSNFATLTVNQAPVINTQPSAGIACSTGATTQFSVGAIGTNITYQWQYSTSLNGTYTNVVNATPAGTTYTGANSATLSVATTSATPSAPTYYYKVVVTGTAPCTTATSSPATLNINAPAITTQPVAATVLRGNSATFTVATSAPSPTYQWVYSTTTNGTYTNVTDSTPAGTTYSGANSATLTVNAATTAVGSNYYYKVIVTSGGCTVTSNSTQMTVTDYCIPDFTNTSVTNDYMSAISIPSVSFSYTGGMVGDAAGDYYAMMPQTATFELAHSYSTSITVAGGGGNPQGVGIWIDFNNDGDFLDTGEFFTPASISSNSTGTMSIVIPSNVSTGVRRMRIRNVRNATVTQAFQCSQQTRGTTLDFMVTITQPSAPSITSFTPETYCGLTGPITVNGTNLTGASLTINGVAASSVVVNSAGTQITATVNAGNSGLVSVTTPGGTATSAALSNPNYSISAPPTISLSSTSGTICMGQSSGVVTVTGAANYTNFTWTSVPAGAAVSGSAAAGFVFSPTANTVYTLTASNPSSGCSTTATYTATMTAAPILVASPASASICNGQIVQLSASQTLTYCTPAMTTVSESGDYIANITFAGINNTTGDGNGAVAGAIDYTYYSDLTANVTAGVGYPISLMSNGASSTYEQHFRVWVDMNQDGTFSSAESVYVSSAPVFGSATSTGTITIPVTAKSGVTRMRVASRYSSQPSATASCAGESQYGEFEDYNINITGGAASPLTWTSSNPGQVLYANAAATTPYTSGGTAYVKPSATTTYTMSLTNGSCTVTHNAVITVNPKEWIGGTSTNWTDANNWCGGQVPTADDQVVITAATNQPVITSGQTAYGNTLTIEDGATMTIQSGGNAIITNEVIVDNDFDSEGAIVGGHLNIQNNANLIQVNDVNNSGIASIDKESAPLFRLDYALWSSPVAGETLKGFSPMTLDNRFYQYNPVTDAYLTVPGTTEFAEGTGYLIRVDNTHPAYDATTNFEGTPWEGTYIGTPNNGNVNVDATAGYNAVGNPYPSPINIAAFYTANQNNLGPDAALYFWRKKNGAEYSSYASLTLEGYTANGQVMPTPDGGQINYGDASNGVFGNELQSNQWVLNPGQGFIVQTNGNDIVFNNGMRRAVNNGQIFDVPDTSGVARLWLNISDATGSFHQAMVSYSSNGTLGIDFGRDGRALTDGSIAIYSIAEDTKLGIQARPPFEDTDVVPMGYKASAAGTYTISLHNAEGLFAQDQDIFLRDNLLGTTHDLKAGDYQFATEAGTFAGRFDVIYAQPLGTEHPTIDPNKVIVYKQGTDIHINSGLYEMKGVTIYDTRGRILFSKDSINATETVINNLHSDQQVLIINIDTNEGKVTKRIIF